MSDTCPKCGSDKRELDWYRVERNGATSRMSYSAAVMTGSRSTHKCCTDDFHNTTPELTVREAVEALSIYGEIQAERARQDEKWGGSEHDRQHTAQEWACILGKHAGRFLEYTIDGANLDGLRYQAVRVAAVACAIIESINAAKREGGESSHE